MTGPRPPQVVTAAQFRARAKAAFLRANPGLVEPRLTWLHVSPPCPYSGDPGWFRVGRFRAEAQGFRTTTLYASLDLTTGALEVR